MSKQILNDLKKLVNDKRITLSIGVYGNSESYGYTIGVYFGVKNDYLGCFNMAATDSRDYTNFLDCVRYIQSVHPTRTNQSVLCSIKVNSKSEFDYLAVTDESNLELFGCRHVKINKDLSELIHESIKNEDFKRVYDANYDSFISTYDYSYQQLFVI